VTAGPKSWSQRPDGLTAGTGWGSWRGAATLEQAPSPPAKVSRGVALHVSSPSEVRGHGKTWFWHISRLEKSSNLDNDNLSALFNSWLAVFSFWSSAKNSFTIVGWGSIDPSSTP